MMSRWQTAQQMPQLQIGSDSAARSWSYRKTYTATITPTTSGTVVVSVPADVATDYAGNSNTASDTYSITVNIPGDGGNAPSAVLTGIMNILDTTPLESLDLEQLEEQLDILRALSDGFCRILTSNCIA